MEKLSEVRRVLERPDIIIVNSTNSYSLDYCCNNVCFDLAPSQPLYDVNGLNRLLHELIPEVLEPYFTDFRQDEDGNMLFGSILLQEDYLKEKLLIRRTFEFFNKEKKDQDSFYSYLWSSGYQENAGIFERESTQIYQRNINLKLFPSKKIAIDSHDIYWPLNHRSISIFRDHIPSDILLYYKRLEAELSTGL